MFKAMSKNRADTHNPHTHTQEVIAFCLHNKKKFIIILFINNIQNSNLSYYKNMFKGISSQVSDKDLAHLSIIPT